MGVGQEPPFPSIARGWEKAERNPEEDLELAGGGKGGGSLAWGGLRTTWVAEGWSWDLRLSRSRGQGGCTAGQGSGRPNTGLGS